MARTADPNSATSEFFINTADNLFLDASTPNTGYAVFGSVSSGSTVVDAMVGAPCSLSPINFDSGFTASPDCVPTPNLVIVNATQTR
jgi:cyclophilin family peptidyl-prolyl cis-trans isomerase